MMLLALLAFSVGIGFARHSGATTVQQKEIQALKLEVAKPDVKWETWLKYGQVLEAAHQYKDAAVAYQQVLKTDPYQPEALWHRAFCLGSALRDTEQFFSFMRNTVDVDPKLAKKVFEQPYAAIYLAEARFQTLKQDAIAGSMD